MVGGQGRGGRKGFEKQSVGGRNSTNRFGRQAKDEEPGGEKEEQGVSRKKTSNFGRKKSKRGNGW